MGTEMIRASLKALIFTIVITILLLLTLNAIALAAPDPNAISGLLALATVMLSSLSAGIASSRVHPEKPFVCTLITEGIYILIHLIVRLTLAGGQASFLFALTVYTCAYIAAFMGCLLFRSRISKTSKNVRKFKKYSKKMHT